MDDGSFASVDALHLDHDGIYYYNKKRLGSITSEEFQKHIDTITNNIASMSANETEFDEICEYYSSVNSINKAANQFGLSEQRIRRILITRGLYTSDLYNKIKEMFSLGKTVDEISKELGIPRKQIVSYLPYE